MSKTDIIEKIEKSDLIYKDIISYIEEYLFNKKGIYIYFKDYFGVKNYLQENSRYINPELLEPTEELWSDMLNESYYEHKDLDRRIGQLYENL